MPLSILYHYRKLNVGNWLSGLEEIRRITLRRSDKRSRTPTIMNDIVMSRLCANLVVVEEIIAIHVLHCRVLLEPGRNIFDFLELERFLNEYHR